jgi:hypothetical protein
MRTLFFAPIPFRGFPVAPIFVPVPTESVVGTVVEAIVKMVVESIVELVFVIAKTIVPAITEIEPTVLAFVRTERLMGTKVIVPVLTAAAQAPGLQAGALEGMRSGPGGRSREVVVGGRRVRVVILRSVVVRAAEGATRR